MKGRTRELAFEAGGKFRKFNKGAAMYQNVESDLQNFAELIIRECAEIAKHNVMNISTYGDAEFVEEQIKKHFGVAE